MRKLSFLSILFTAIFIMSCCFEVNAQITKTSEEVIRPLTRNEVSAGIQYSEEQKTVLGQYYQVYLKKMKSIRENKELSGEDKAAAYLDVKTEYRNNIKSSLTAEQYEQYIAVEKLKQDAIKQRQGLIKKNSKGRS